MKTKLFLLDAYGLIFRAYYANTSNVNNTAVAGFLYMLLKLIGLLRPQHIAAVFDYGGKNFRHNLYQQYKSNRPVLPDSLKQQLQAAREVPRALGITVLEYPGVEADDVIASIVKSSALLYDEIVIISRDKDLMQLIDETNGICMYDPVTHKYIKSLDVIKKFGVSPKQLHDFLTLVGDSADNIPGAPGIGPKTAALFLNTYISLEKILANIHNLGRRAVPLLTCQDQLSLSRNLIALYQDVEVIHHDYTFTYPDYAKLTALKVKYGLYTLPTSEKMSSAI